MPGAPTFDDLGAAAARIARHIHRTPVATCATLDRELDARVFFKCENLQKVGAFKARGATNAVASLDPSAAGRGVITHSSGNHAAALAYAAAIRGIRCTVVMPEDAPRIKVDAVRGYGAEIVFCARSRRAEVAEALAAERGMSEIHPFENPRVIAGQATAAMELLEEVPDLDLVIAPVGGGGLLSGTAIATRAARPGASVWGAEPEAADDAYRSLASGVRQPPIPSPETLADGLMTGLGAINFAILRAAGAQIVTVSEESIRDAAVFLLTRLKLVVEPSAATVLAALRREAPGIRGRRVGAILSGGNTDFSWWPWRAR